MDKLVKLGLGGITFSLNVKLVWSWFPLMNTIIMRNKAVRGRTFFIPLYFLGSKIIIGLSVF